MFYQDEFSFCRLLLDELQESAQVLKYSLYLDISKTNFFEQTIPDIQHLISFKSQSYLEINQWFEKISETIFERIDDFLPDGCHGFFGALASEQNANRNMGELGDYHHIRTSWKFMLSQHAIFSSYIRLRKLIGYRNPLSPYMTLKYGQTSKEASKNPNLSIGLDYELRENILNFENFQLSVSSSSTEAQNLLMDSSEVSENNFAYIRKLQNIKKKIKEYSGTSPSLYEKGEDNTYHIFADQIELGIWLSRKKEILLSILNIYKKNMLGIAGYKKFRANCEKLTSFDGNFFSKADQLYIHYQIEHLFHFNMVSCLFQNIKNHNENLTTDEIKLLSGCCKLPNIFSRHLLVQMAFDLLPLKRTEKENFFRNSIIKQSSLMTNSPTRYSIIEGLDSLTNWYELYTHFISYMTSCLCPLYESFFFWLLYSDYKAIRSDCTDEALLMDLYKILSNYLSQEDVFNYFLHPDQKVLEYEKEYASNKPTINKKIFQPISPNLPESVTLNQAKLFKNCLMSSVESTINQSEHESSFDFITQSYLHKRCEKLDGYIHSFVIWNLAGFDI